LTPFSDIPTSSLTGEKIAQAPVSEVPGKPFCGTISRAGDNMGVVVHAKRALNQQSLIFLHVLYEMITVFADQRKTTIVSKFRYVIEDTGRPIVWI
jgi:hypothetical protein